MAKKSNKNMELSQKLAAAKNTAFSEEVENARNNYASLDRELASYELQIPYPQTGPFDIGVDYEDVERVQYEKQRNQEHRERCEQQKKYCSQGSLYCGHVKFQSGSHYYIMEDPSLQTKLANQYNKFNLIHSDDKKYQRFVQAWRYPDEETDVEFSRDVSLHNRAVKEVTVRRESKDEVFSQITANYLREALVRNKNKDGIQSIIQTIERKQNEIRSLPVNTSFIVQGCAGSGKTIVLLHQPAVSSL